MEKLKPILGVKVRGPQKSKLDWDHVFLFIYLLIEGATILDWWEPDDFVEKIWKANNCQLVLMADPYLSTQKPFWIFSIQKTALKSC